MSALAEHRSGADVVRTGLSDDDAAPTRLRADFGAHLEADYPRLVAQLYAITLDAGEAHDVVQDAYSRAWRRWAVIRRSRDPSAWVRGVAVRSTIRSWRRVLELTRTGARQPVGPGIDPRSGALLSALGRLPASQRRAVVLFHMAGMSLAEIAAIERTSSDTVAARLARGRHVITWDMADVLPEVLETGSRGEPVLAGEPYDFLPMGYGARADRPGNQAGADHQPPGDLDDYDLDDHDSEVRYPERYNLGVPDLGGYGSGGRGLGRDPDGPDPDRNGGGLTGHDTREHR